MARRRRKVDTYPPEFRHFLEEAVTKDRPEVICPTMNARITLRSQCYQFFAAIREEAEAWAKEAKGKGITHRTEKPWFMEYAEWTKRVTIKMSEEGIVFVPKSSLQSAQLLAGSTSTKVEIPQIAGKKIKVEDEELKAQLSEMFGEGEWVEVVPGG